MVSEYAKHLAKRHYRRDESGIAAIEEFIRDQDEGFYTSSFQGLQHRWKKCVDRKRYYDGESVSNHTSIFLVEIYLFFFDVIAL